MAYIDDMIERISSDSTLSDFEIVNGKNGNKIKFPLTKPVVSLLCETVRTDFPLGSDENAFVTENINATVSVPEKDGGKFCKECAETTAWALLACDEEKRIVGISMDGCVFDEHIMGWRIKITVELSIRYKEKQG